MSSAQVIHPWCGRRASGRAGTRCACLLLLLPPFHDCCFQTGKAYQPQRYLVKYLFRRQMPPQCTKKAWYYEDRFISHGRAFRPDVSTSLVGSASQCF